MSNWYQQLLRRDFSTFIGKTFSTVDPGTHYLPNWHIDLIAEYLEAVRRSQINRLIINMPPRSLKSICVSVAWPAWLLGHDPASRILAASYASSLALKHSVDCRLVVNSPWYRELFPEVKLTHDQNEKYKFVTTQRGFRLATSVGGSITGEGGNFLIIDDPLNPAQAMNTCRREGANHWFDHTFASRLDDKKKGRIVLVMQRLHTEDLSGYLLNKGGWELLSLSAVASIPEIYHLGRIYKERAVGDVLHEQREDQGLIERAKIELGAQAFTAQYQQQPLAAESSMVKAFWLKRFKVMPAHVERCVQSWDTAIKAGPKHDASVCLTFMESGGQSYLCDVAVARVEYPDLKRMFYAMAEKWKPDAILIEDKSSGQQLLQDVRRESALPVIPIRAIFDKVTRFAAVSAMVEAGRVLLPEQAHWLTDFESELFAFPEGYHDDQVDALTHYLDWLRNTVWERIRIRKI